MNKQSLHEILSKKSNRYVETRIVSVGVNFILFNTCDFNSYFPLSLMALFIISDNQSYKHF